MPDQEKPVVYVIDGFAQMFRAYYAIRGGMTSPVTGEPTGATFAFSGMLIKLFAQYRPTHVAMAMDADAKTFRDDFYPEYKANRDAPPDEFKAQIPRMVEVAKLFGLPVIEAAGFEADDIMATLAARISRGDFDDALPGAVLRMVAKDKDLEQVISDRVELFDVHTDQAMDAAALLEKRGITPQQVIDYQTLIGDSTDNIPGVKGIGPKTATKLLAQFGTVENLVANTDQLKGKQKENIENAAADGTIELTRKLVTLATDMDTVFDFTALATDGTAKIDGDRLQEVFRDLGFNRHREDLAKLLGSAPPDKAATPRRQDAKNAKEGSEKTEAKKKQGQKNEAGFGLFAGAGGEQTEEDAVPLREVTGDYRAVLTQAELDDVVATLRKQTLIAVDTETVGLGHDAALCGVCLSWAPGSGVYIPTLSPDPGAHLDTAAVIETLRPVLEDPAVAKCGHNIKYDDLVLRNALPGSSSGGGKGIAMRGVVFDSMIGAFLAGAPGRGMDDLALAELSHECIPISELIGPRPRKKSDPPQKTMDQLPLDRVTPYAAEDADITLQLCTLFRDRLDGMGMTDLYERVEMPLVRVLATMEQQGITVDARILDGQREQLQQRIDTLRTDILDRAKVDFNPDSPKQLGDVLFNQLGFKPTKKTKTGYSTDSEVLEKLAALKPDEVPGVAEEARAIPTLMVEYRMLTKLVGTYLVALKEAIADPATGGDGRVHARFHQTGAATGRLSSSDPNLQNIPIRTDVGREIRKAFVAPPGHVLIAADYSQIELRVLAHLSQDAALTAAFKDDQDIHTAVAAQVFETPPDEVTGEQRARAKVINFGIIYGITAYGLARRIDEMDNEAAAKLIADYKLRFTGIDRFLDECVAHAREHGYVQTVLGRRRAIPDIDDRNGQKRQLAERLAINSVVQGSAADLIKVAMVNLQHRIEEESLPAKLLLQIHDELVVECPASEADRISQVVQEAMTGAMELSVPLKVDVGVGKDWFEAK
ncbi:DNA polymerase I [Phycisphaeraceae bacterium D3-23]